MAGPMNEDDSRLSMRDKAARKRKLNELHESNYRAGSVPVNERQLHRTGVRGRKIYVLAAFLILLFLLCFINMIILIVIYDTLDISYRGMRTLSFEKDGKLKWLKDSDLEYVFPYDGVIGGFEAQNLGFHGDNQNVMFNVGATQNMSSLIVGPDGTVVQIKDSFQFIDPVAKKRILQLSKDSKLSVTGMLTGPTLKTVDLRTHRVVAPKEDSLSFTGKDMTITGHEGIFMDGRTVELSAGQDITLKVKDMDNILHLNGATGMQLERGKLKDTSTAASRPGVTRYRLCACSNNGRLFRLPLQDGSKVTCATAKTNPCA